MSEALARIYALQQRQINEIEQANRQRHAKRSREILAFMNSGLPELYAECAQLPLKQAAEQRMYKKVFAQCTYEHCDTRNRQVSEMAFMSTSGSGSGPRWWCQENADSGRMTYFYSKNGTYSHCDVQAAEPAGPWLDEFIKYIADVCDPQAVAARLSEEAPAPANEPRNSRRQIQKV